MGYVTIKTNRSGYSVDQCGSTLTVSELIGILEDFDEDAPVYFSNDNGYTYGSISEYDFSFVENDEDDDDDEY